MPRKQAILNDSSAAAAPARAAKPKAPRVKSAKHTKAEAPDTAAPETTQPALPVETVTIEAIEFVSAEPSFDVMTAAQVVIDPREEISRIAYGYWVARGYTGGDPVEDWVRAENEYRNGQTA